MKLEGKKALISRALNIGKNRIVLNIERLDEIKEAITKQDIRELQKDGAITIKEIKGKRTIKKRKTRRRQGSIKKQARKKKKEYMAITRKLRKHLAPLKASKEISSEENKKLRKEIRARLFKSKAQLKERMQNIDEKIKAKTHTKKKVKKRRKK